MKTGDDMKLNRLTIIGCFIALLAPALATHSAAQSGESGDLKTNMVEVRTFDGLSVIPTAGASLSRNNDGAFMTFHTSGLTPGNVINAPSLFLESEAPAVGITDNPSNVRTSTIFVLRSPLSPLCAAECVASAGARSAIKQPIIVKRFHFISCFHWDALSGRVLYRRTQRSDSRPPTRILLRASLSLLASRDRNVGFLG